MTGEFAVVLTSKDFTLLENLVHNWGEPFPGASEYIRRKLAAATVVSQLDVPSDVVTLNSRVRFRAGSGFPEERTIVGGPSEAVYGMTLPLASARGLALIGAAVGQIVEAFRPNGSTETLFIQAVLYQPRLSRPKVGLKIVSSQDLPDTRSIFSYGHSKFTASRSGDDDDPGPSAA